VLVEPSDQGAALIDAIHNAKTSVHMTMYLLTARSIVDALVERRSAGVEVKVILNRSFEDSEGSNARVFQELKDADVDIVWSSDMYELTHEKCVIIDGESAWIMTMNATESGLEWNREYIAVDTDRAQVELAESIFAADFTGAPTPEGVDALVVSPVNALDKMRALLASATSSIDVEAEELTDSDIVRDLADKARAGVTVHVVLPTGSHGYGMRAVAELGQAGVEVRGVESPYVHAKAVVIDGRTAFVGSENFSATSLTRNRELGVIFDIASEVAKVHDAIDGDFGQGSPE
jgi:phosphatidylserine/phosphatidylglycerophosphate/cardiolipin synthase-like enzyme